MLSSVLTVFAFVAVATAGVARAADVKDPANAAAIAFSSRCSTCHNIGGGVKVGPDLLGVTQRRTKDWFARFARGPSAAIDAGDPFAVELFAKFQPVRMPDQPLTDEEVDGLWAYFADCTTKGGCQPVALGPRWGLDGTPEEIARGRAIFNGESHLRNGGAPCFACHALRGARGGGAATGVVSAGGTDDGLGFMGGGTLGPNLTFSYARLGEKDLTPLLATMSTPVMHAVYGTAPLEEEEQFAVKAFLADLSRDGSRAKPERDFVFLGLEGMAIVLGAFTLRTRLRRNGDRAGEGDKDDDEKQPKTEPKNEATKGEADHT